MSCFVLPGTTRLPGSYKENERCVVSCCQGRHGCQAATRRMRDVLFSCCQGRRGCQTATRRMRDVLFRVARDDTVARQLQGE